MYLHIFRLSLKNVAYIGLRQVDPMERLIAEKFNVKMLGMDVSYVFFFNADNVLITKSNNEKKNISFIVHLHSL